MTHSDIKPEHPLLKVLPDFLRPYAMLARIDRPVGIWLLLLPALWSVMLASGGVLSLNRSDITLIILFFVGAVLMRSAGCVMNDLWDRKLDAKVERTKNRPLASGVLKPRHAIVFLALLLGGAFWILMQLSTVAILLGFLAFPLVALYPLMKRITWWPQFFLGITINAGILLGWASVTAIVELPAILLYVGAIFWTIGYDTIYAHQDKEDDMHAGIKSTAIKLGDRSRVWVYGFYGAALLFISAGFYYAGAGPVSYFLLGVCVIKTVYILRQWNMHDPQNSLHTFKANTLFGLCVLIAACF